MSFFVAMQNRRATASYWHPQTIISERSEFLIVSRSGGRNEFLSISNAGACTGLEDMAPPELNPDLVLCATLVSQGPDGGEVFLVERKPPKGIDVQGSFLGGDGYFYLQQTDESLTLRGATRLRPGRRTEAVADRCLLLGDNEPGATVHFKAAYIPWESELLPSGFANGRKA